MNRHTILALVVFSFSSCDTTDPPEQGEPAVQFSAIETLCTESWLQIKFLSASASRDCRIVRDTVTVFDGHIAVYDGTRLEFTPHPDSISGTIATVFSVTGSSVYIGTNLGLYHAASNTRGEARRIGYQLQTFPAKIRGSGHNDLFLVGNSGVVAHFQRDHMEGYPELSIGNYGSVEVRGNSVVVVGESNYRPIVARGTRL